MPSTYSTSLRLELPATGEKRGTWGTVVNTNLGTLLEQAIGGYVGVTQADADTTLTASNAASDEARNNFIKLTGTIGAGRNLIVPTAEKTYWIWNATTGGFAVTVKPAAGTGVAIAANCIQGLQCDGTNVIAVSVPYNVSTTSVPIANGGTGGTSASTARTALGLVIGTDVQAYDADLAAVAGLSSNGMVARTGAGTAAVRTVTGTADKITVTNGDGVSGNPTLTIATGYVGQTSITTLGTVTTGVWNGTTIAVANGGTGSTSAGDARTALGLAIGTNVQAYDADLAAVAGLSSNGMIARTGSGTAAVRTITGTTNRVTVTNGDGVSGNPTLDVAATYVGQTSIATLGTVTAGVWNGTTIAVANGGTGATTATGAINALLPTQSGQSGKILGTDGSNTSWVAQTALSYFTETQNTSSPNNSVYASVLTASGATNVDIVIDPAGTGAILAQIPTGNSTGGNKRGTNAVDFQMSRSDAAQVASGANAFIGGGELNTASGARSVVAGGYAVTVSGADSFGAGRTITVSGIRAAAIGEGLSATGNYSFVTGYGATDRGTAGVRAHATDGSSGAHQVREFVLRASTTNSTPRYLTLTGTQFSPNESEINLPNDATYGFVARIVARRADADNESAFYELKGCIDRNASAGTVALVGSVTKEVIAEDTSAWDVSADVGTTSGGLTLIATGEAAKTISWTAHVTTIEVVG